MTVKKFPNFVSGKIFEGINFILTQSRRQANDTDDVTSALETETEEDEILEESDNQENSSAIKPLVMKKKELKKMIVENGGIYLDEFPGPKQKIPDSVLLISDRFLFTFTLAVISLRAQ